MRYVLFFLKKFYAFFLFLALEGVCIFLIVQNNRFHKASYISAANAITGQVYTSVSNVSGYFNLKEKNDSLAADNARLRNFLQSSLQDNKLDIRTITDPSLRQKYTYISGKVINNSVNKFKNNITINRGSRHGISPGMGVIGGNGIVGIVKDVSENFSVAMSVLHNSLKISVKLAETDYFGSLSWDGEDPHIANLNDIPKHVKINEGDTVVTSGFSSFFPEGIMVGVIESYDLAEGSNFYNIDVHLSTNFEKLNYVYIINYLMKMEQLELEEKLKAEDE